MTKHELFTAAHAMTRDALKRYGKADYRATFGLAVSIIYKEGFTMTTTNTNTNTARAAWNAMSGEEQFNALIAMVWHEVRRHKAESNARGEFVYNCFAWIQTEDNALEVVSEAYCRMSAKLEAAERKAAENGTEAELSLVLHEAVHAAAHWIERAEKRNASALKTRRIKAESEAEAARIEEYIVNNAAPIAEPIAPNPEAAAILAETIAEAAHDKTDARIIKLLALGYTQTEIAAAIGIDARNVRRRMVSIRETYNAPRKAAEAARKLDKAAAAYNAALFAAAYAAAAK